MNSRQAGHAQFSSIGLLSSVNSAFFKLSVPVAVNAVPFRARRVGNTQSNMSIPRAIISSNCGGVPSPIA